MNPAVCTALVVADSIPPASWGDIDQRQEIAFAYSAYHSRQLRRMLAEVRFLRFDNGSDLELWYG